MNQIDLSPLKGLHAMEQPSWWPLAYGWWVVAAGVIGILFVCWFVWKWWHNRPVVCALRELHQQVHNISEDLEFLRELSRLMKRVAILKCGREQIAPLDETQWQRFLVSSVKDCFSEKEAKLIACSPYMMKIKEHLDRSKMEQDTEKWIRFTLKNKNLLDKQQKNV